MKFNCEAWKVKDDLRRLTYNLMRCPPEFLDILGQMYEYTKPEIAGWGLSKNCQEIVFMPMSPLPFQVKPCQLCASRTWMAITIFLAPSQMVLKVSGEKLRTQRSQKSLK